MAKVWYASWTLIFFSGGCREASLGARFFPLDIQTPPKVSLGSQALAQQQKETGTGPGPVVYSRQTNVKSEVSAGVDRRRL